MQSAHPARIPSRTNHLISRRHLLTAIAALPLLLSACGTKSTAPQSTATLDDLPTGLGRGFPLATTAGIDNKGTGINTGDMAPNFLIQLEDGSALSFHDLKGRPRLINFWATWCGPCRIEMPEIVRAASKNEDLLVVAVNVEESLVDVTAFAEDFDMNLLVPLDSKGEVRSAYAIRGMPTSIFVDREGRIHTVWMGILTPSKLEELVSQLV